MNGNIIHNTESAQTQQQQTPTKLSEEVVDNESPSREQRIRLIINNIPNSRWWWDVLRLDNHRGRKSGLIILPHR